MSNKKILLSGVQPSGNLHIGNYFGALKQFVELQDTHQCHIMIADYHALHTVKSANELRENIKNVVLDYLAVGLDPEKVVIFKQSDVAAHTELAWIFNTITTVPSLMLAHAFKARVDQLGAEELMSAEKKSDDDQSTPYDRFKEVVNKVFKGISVGTFDYPVLMAADILLYDTDVVPVGQDQKQHIEITRDIAQKFNSQYGEIFKLPEPMILANVATVPGLNGQKMSKSYNNTIPLFASDEEITKAVMSIVTDTEGDIPKNVYAIHKLFRPEAELAPLYEASKGKYKPLKDALATDIIAFVTPLRERREKFAADMSHVDKILFEGAERAENIASSKLLQVKKAIGVL